jgi:tetratricopeptide (TPR) repeat protein
VSTSGPSLPIEALEISVAIRGVGDIERRWSREASVANDPLQTSRTDDPMTGMASINLQSLRNWLPAAAFAVFVILTGQRPALAASFDESRCFGRDTAVTDEKIAACDRFIASDGSLSLPLATALEIRAGYHFMRREYDLAIEDYSQSIALDHSCQTTKYLNRGLAYAAKGDEDQAFQDFNQQIACTPQYQDAFYQRGVALIGKRQFDAAMRDFDEVIRLCHSHFDGKFFCQRVLAETYFRQGQVEFATHNFSSAPHKFIRAIEMAIWPNRFY